MNTGRVVEKKRDERKHSRFFKGRCGGHHVEWLFGEGLLN